MRSDLDDVDMLHIGWRYGELLVDEAAEQEFWVVFNAAAENLIQRNGYQ